MYHDHMCSCVCVGVLSNCKEKYYCCNEGLRSSRFNEDLFSKVTVFLNEQSVLGIRNHNSGGVRVTKNRFSERILAHKISKSISEKQLAATYVCIIHV